MTKMKICKWEVTNYLQTQEDVTHYLLSALEEDNPQLWMAAIRDVVKVYGTAEVSKQIGIKEEDLNRFLSKNEELNLIIFLKIVRYLGLNFTTKPFSK